MMAVKSILRRSPADCCGACSHFLYEDVFGSGYCDERDVETGCGGWCKYYRNRNKNRKIYETD